MDPNTFEPHILHFVLLFGTGLAAGFLNTVAFGGSFLSLIVLMEPSLLGLSAALANGTNRVAIFCQNFSAILGYRHKGVSDFRYSIWIAIPALLGAAIGATFANVTKDDAFNLILAIVMIAMLIVTLINPTERLKDRIGSNSTGSKIIAMIAFFFIGIYGGFIQAGAGLLIITALRLLTGTDLVRANAIKVFVIFSYTVVALGTFIYHGNVYWSLGIALAMGNACGAWLGSRLAVAKGERWIKLMLIIAFIGFAINLIRKSLFAG